MNQVLNQFIAVLPDLLWAAIAFWALYFSLPHLLREAMPRLRAAKGLGIETDFIVDRVGEIADERHILFEPIMRKRLKNRLDRVGYAGRGARILWVDDEPDNNRREIEMLEGLGVTVRTESNTGAGMARLADWKPDVVLSDMARPGNDEAGIELADAVVRSGYDIPVILYTCPETAAEPRPASVFGVAARPDRFLHLVLDGLERRRL